MRKCERKAALYAPHVILTAAHCHPDGDEPLTVMINNYHSSPLINQRGRQVGLVSFGFMVVPDKASLGYMLEPWSALGSMTSWDEASAA
jgi:hypothetical protein